MPQSPFRSSLSLLTPLRRVRAARQDYGGPRALGQALGWAAEAQSNQPPSSPLHRPPPAPSYHQRATLHHSASASSPSPPSGGSTHGFSLEQYHMEADAFIDTLVGRCEAICEQRADVDCEYSAGVLTLLFPPHGTYVLNKQPPNQQIWLSSPLSGPKRYDLVAEEWTYLRDGSHLTDLLKEELGVDMAAEEGEGQ